MKYILISESGKYFCSLNRPLLTTKYGCKKSSYKDALRSAVAAKKEFGERFEVVKW